MDLEKGPHRAINRTNNNNNINKSFSRSIAYLVASLNIKGPNLLLFLDPFSKLVIRDTTLA